MSRLHKKLAKTLVKYAKAYFEYCHLRFQDIRAGWQLRCKQNKLKGLKPNAILLVACLRNEKFRMPYFVEYYRKLGVEHFLFVDNGSTDGFAEWAAEQPDVSVWYTTASYKASRFGMLWLNALLYRHGQNHWCVVVDPDEFLVYPYMETRSLRALTSFLEEERRPCMHALMLDAYGEGPIDTAVLQEGGSPFDVCPYFDKEGYVQLAMQTGNYWIRGGPRLRTMFLDNPDIAPALNKIPLIKWQAHYHYRSSMHHAHPRSVNSAIHDYPLTATLFHFKFISQLKEKASEEMKRKEHFAGSREYVRYQSSTDIRLFDPDISRKYTNPAQLIELGLMSPGRWF